MSEMEGEQVALNIRDFGSHPLALRLWHGMTLSAWLRALRGRWHLISPRRYPLILTVTLFSINNQLLKWISQLVYGHRLAKVETKPDPVFILGHWRSGTTWLHDIMTSGSHYAGPSRSACFCPEFFLLTQGLIKRVLQKVIPHQRPMDNVVLNLDGAEEDEHAICLSGAPSLYQFLMFPSSVPQDSIKGLSALSPECAALRRRVWLNFLRKVQFLNPNQRLVLKSPTHSLYIAEILSDFPEAKFVHIQRDPYHVLKSSIHSGRAMQAVCALQDHVPAMMFSAEQYIAKYVAFHDKLEADKRLIPEGQLTCIKYEALRADPVGVVRDIFDALELDRFNDVEEDLHRKAEAAKSYQNNSYVFESDFVALVDAHCKTYFDLYGYAPMGERVVVQE